MVRSAAERATDLCPQPRDALEHMHAETSLCNTLCRQTSLPHAQKKNLSNSTVRNSVVKVRQSLFKYPPCYPGKDNPESVYVMNVFNFLLEQENEQVKYISF